MARTDVGTVEDLHASATKMVGLDDFGPDDDDGALPGRVLSGFLGVCSAGDEIVPEAHAGSIADDASNVKRAR